MSVINQKKNQWTNKRHKFNTFLKQENQNKYLNNKLHVHDIIKHCTCTAKYNNISR